MRSTFGLLVLALTISSIAHAQTGMHVGFALQSGQRDFYPGYSLAATQTIRAAARIGFRFDVGVQSFGNVATYTLPCAITASDPQPCVPVPGKRLTIASSTAAVVIAEHPGRNTFYWVAGVGVYAFTASPSDGRYGRPGWNVGGGFNLGRNVVFEVRYHRLIDPRTTRAFAPVAVGFRF